MVSSQSAGEIFHNLKEDPQNQVCFDCGSSESTFASVSYGSYICPRCVEVHRSLGQSVSFVKALAADSWSFKQLKLMTIGGNSELRAFFALYSLPADSPIDFKYRTLAAKYYRARLLAYAENVSFALPQPTQEEGLALLNTSPALEEASEASSGGLHDMMTSAYNTIVSAGSAVAAKAQEIGQDPRVKAWQDRANEVFSNAQQAARTGAEWTMEKGREIGENPTVQSVVSTAAAAANRVGEFASTQYKSFTTNPRVQELSGEAQHKLKELEQKVSHQATDIYQRFMGSSQEERPSTPAEYR